MEVSPTPGTRGRSRGQRGSGGWKLGRDGGCGRGTADAADAAERRLISADQRGRVRVEAPRSKPDVVLDAASCTSGARPPCTRISPTTPQCIVRVIVRGGISPSFGGCCTSSRRSQRVVRGGERDHRREAARRDGAHDVERERVVARRSRRCAISAAGTVFAVTSCEGREMVAAIAFASSTSHGASSRT